jgi:hypothetical protein
MRQRNKGRLLRDKAFPLLGMLTPATYCLGKSAEKRRKVSQRRTSLSWRHAHLGKNFRRMGRQGWALGRA